MQKRNDKPEPMAWAVYCPRGQEFDYLIFHDLQSAYDYAGEKTLEDGEPEVEILPLFPGGPIVVKSDDLP